MAPLLLTSTPHNAQNSSRNNFGVRDIEDDEEEQGGGGRRRRGERTHRTRESMRDELPRRRFNAFNSMPPPPPPPFQRSRRYRHHGRRGYDDDYDDVPYGTSRRYYPKSADGRRDLTFELDLGSPKDVAKQLQRKRRTNTWPDLGARNAGIQEAERLNILASTSYSDESGNATIELKCDPSEQKSQASYFVNWLHVTQQNMDLDEFERLALQSPKISDDMALVVSFLMEKVRKELERPFVHGRYMVPGCIRCDGKDPGSVDKEDIWATWISVPYFTLSSLQGDRNASSGFGSQLHPIRTLLQTQYEGQSTSDPDMGQYLKLHDGGKVPKTLHVPQIWFLVLGAETVISCSSNKLDSMIAPAIVKSFQAADSERVSLVKVIDPYKRQFFFPVESCSTFFELKQLISDECLEDIFIPIEDCDIRLDENVNLTAPLWIDTIRTKRSLVISVSVIERETERAILALASPPEKGPDSDSESSDSDTSEEDVRPRSSVPPNLQQQIIVMSDHNKYMRPSSQRQSSRERQKNVEHVQVLTRSGMIVNDPASLAPKKTVKMYRIEPEGEEEKPAPKQPGSDSGGAANKPKPAQSKDSDPKEPSKPTASEEAPKGPKLAKRLPPFFTWSLEEAAGEDEGKRKAKLPTDSAGLKQILSNITKRIRTKDFRVSVKSRDIFGVEDEFRAGRYYDRTDDVSFKKLMSIRQDLSKAIRKPPGEPSGSGNPSSTKPGSPSPPTQTQFILPQKVAIRFIERQREKILEQVQEMIRLTEELCACFTPISFDHPLLLKIWGSMASFATLYSASIDPTVLADAASKSNTSSLWTIRNFNAAASSGLAGDDAFVPPDAFMECPDCSSGKKYASPKLAVSHLMSKHFSRRAFTMEEEEKLAFWVRPAEWQDPEERNTDALILLERLTSQLNGIHAKAQEIMEGVATIDDDHDGETISYHLPSALVRAFEDIVVFLLVAGYSIAITDRENADKTSKKAEGGKAEKVIQYWPFIDFYGVRSDLSMSKAFKAIILMVRTGKTSESVNFTAVGPRYIVLVLSKLLLSRNLKADTDIVKVYRDCTSKLQYDVYHKPPRRRLLGDIQRLQEEVESVATIIVDQRESIRQYGHIGSPESYRISSQSRNQQYELEVHLGQSCLDALSDWAEDLLEITSRLALLERKARYRIDVLEEDNSKAIFVFTVVTAIFLPLSFFTSYLGMNTADIRNMNRSQSLFWIVAAPVTVVVLGLAVLASYKGDAAREWFSERKSGMARSSRARENAAEDEVGESEILRRRKKARSERLQVRFRGSSSEKEVDVV